MALEREGERERERERERAREGVRKLKRCANVSTGRGGPSTTRLALRPEAGAFSSHRM